MKASQLSKISGTTFIVSKVMRKMNLPKIVQVNFNNMRHRLVLNYLEKEYSYITDNYLQREDVLGTIPRKIWIFWWQGIDAAPLLVKECIIRIKRNVNAEVILITKQNFKNYTDISNSILEKFYSGKISITHFSDVLRFNLLKNHGGLWVDATVYFAKQLPDDIWYQDYYSSGPFQDDEHFNISLGEWSSFFQGGKRKALFFCYMDEFYHDYWCREDETIDYFLMDYVMRIAKNNGILKLNSIKQGQENPNMFELQPLLNRQFEKITWEEIIKDTFAFKLSYKKRIDKNEGTFFEKLLINESRDFQ